MVSSLLVGTLAFGGGIERRAASASQAGGSMPPQIIDPVRTDTLAIFDHEMLAGFDTVDSLSEVLL
jgi:hypothetical protein